ncbi:MAG TPA: glycosyltransferase [Dokdonella sp.]
MAERARVLVVSDEMEVGGSQRQIAHLLPALDRVRWDAELAYFRERSFLVDRLAAAGIAVHEIPKRGRLDAAFVRRLAALLRRGRYDVVHCFSLTAEIWVRALLPLAPRTAFVASVRGLSLGYSGLQWRLKRWIVRRADAIVANARAGAAHAAARTGEPVARFTLVPNGVDVPAPLAAAARADARAALEVPPGRTIALFVGRFVAAKNLPLLLDALAALPPERRAYLLLAGDGPLAAELRARAQALGLERDLRFLGERADARTLMSLADFLVLPSREEGLSNVLLEAMAAGCAPLASDAGGNPEAVADGRTGLLFPSGDRDALAAALARLAGDANLRARLGAAARAEVERDYALDELARRTAAVYERAIAAARARRAGAHRHENTEARGS